jgi:hypothetical protein
MLSTEKKSEIKGFLEKYEKYFNFQESQLFESHFPLIFEDICKKCSLDESNYEEAKDYIKDLHSISEGEGLSFILSPGPTFSYNQPDQVQRLQY